MIRASSLGLFVPGRWSEPYNPITGGMGYFVPGQLRLPENPVMGMGYFVPGKFTVPENPVMQGLSGCRGMGCPGSQGCGCKRGMGDISTDFTDMMSGAAPWTTYALYGGGALAAMWLLSALFASRPSGYRAARRTALSKVRSQYPTRAGRVSRSAKAAVAAF
jgi:hypothetical protein